MKAKIRILFIYLFMFSLLMNCQREKSDESEWQGSLEEENGVQIVNNPEAPFYGNLELELELDLIIGNEEDDHYFFYRAHEVVVDSQENIYVMDAGNFRIQKFSRSGEYLQTIGEKGQGPGEFDQMYSFYIDQKGQIYVLGGTKIHKFNEKGEFEKSIPLALRMYNFWVSPEDFIYGIVYTSTEEGRKRRIVKVNMEGKEVDEIAQFACIDVVSRKSEGRTMAFSLTHSYNHSLCLAPSKFKNLIYGYSADYRLFRVNSKGEIDLIINKKEPYHSISIREKADIVQGIKEHMSNRSQKWPEDVIKEACQFPAHRPFFSDIATDDKRRIYVRRVKSVLDEKETQEFDIISADGFYLYRTEIDFMPYLIKRGFIYRMKSYEETGSLKLIRYQIKNWDQIKTTLPITGSKHNLA